MQHFFAFQRFGVKQKEKIASFKTSVDVLTLSATPIPRTLYLALTGFRDARYLACGRHKPRVEISFPFSASGIKSRC